MLSEQMGEGRIKYEHLIVFYEARQERDLPKYEIITLSMIFLVCVSENNNCFHKIVIIFICHVELMEKYF